MTPPRTMILRWVLIPIFLRAGTMYDSQSGTKRILRKAPMAKIKKFKEIRATF